MTLTEIVKIVSERQGSPLELAWGFAQDTIDVLVDVLESGEEVKIRGLGTFKWVNHGGGVVKNPRGVREYGPGMKLKFFPAYKLRKRRAAMSEDGMTKYGVVLDDEKTKEASEGAKSGTCAGCGRPLDDAGACPVHGTEPLEPAKG